MTLDQGGHAVIGSDTNKESSLVAIKRIKKLNKNLINRIRPFSSDHLVQIRNMYEDDEDVVIVYEAMDVTLRQLTGILRSVRRLAKLFYVTWNVLIVLKQLLDGLSYLHKELTLYHGALSCGTILLNLDGRVKIGEFFKEKKAGADDL